MKNTTCHAFTLVELLTVIAIIGILAAILIPTAASVRKTAKMSRSAAQLRGLCIGILTNTTANGTTLPLGYDQPAGEVWGQKINADSPDVFASGPSVLAPLDTLPRTAPDENNPANWRSYSMVRNLDTNGILGVAGYYYNATNNAPAVSLSAIEIPSRTLLLVERFDRNNKRNSSSCSVIDSAASQMTAEAVALTGGKFAYGFCDGHVQILKPEDTIGKGSLAHPRGMWTIRAGD
ncbi:prepilin-type N-terminal cleavage/methylation domain-containing protein [Opitutaceae bacterium TAV4]|nr:prepilin-type N-terminal cleavage/methylation domain-containing protein [Opitutaceae bacterium TAV4]RRJ99186.1 prepilin-type N-terminal cleavage/methylation domain-containing protein [Opitutaceae bacterium TAV3]